MEFDLLILLIWGFVFGFTLAFGIGANDVANAFGTTIGSGAISIRNAFILASICEIVGAVLLGGGVATELSKGVIDISLFIEPDVLSLGYLSVLIACTIWLITASAMRLPVSATQSAVGGMIGMSVVIYGFDSIGWHEIGRICLSWIISPLLSGTISAIIYTLMKTVIFKHKTAEIQMRNACYLLPFLYFITFGVNTFGCLFGRPQFIPNVEAWPWWVPVVSAIAIALLVAIPVRLVYIPRLKTSINTEILPDFELTTYKDVESNQETSERTSCCSSLRKIIKAQEIEEIGPIFFILQISTSCFGAIAHGGNDVANAIAPVTAMYEIYETNDIPQEGVPTATWILLFGGLGITAGLWAMGKRVVKTLGSDLAAITPPKGFAIELGASLTVLLASQIHLPISTTFCKVGSIVFIGLSNGKNEVSWKIVLNVAMAWVLTVPVSGLISSAVMASLLAILHPEPLDTIPWNMTTTATTYATSAIAI